MEKLKICYIGGGSRNWAWVLLQDLAFEADISGTVELYDINGDAARDNEAIGNALMARHNPGQWRFHANDSLADSLTGSDFVFVSILPGDFEEMAVDVHAPEKFGIYQSVGDTAGPGGIMRALRTVPQFQVIARAVKKYAPDAWVLNYTNPMTICTRALYEEFPEIKAFGCCHEVFNTQKFLRHVLEDAGVAKADDIKREDIITNVLGINHFTWMDAASWKDVDILPLYSAFSEKYAAEGYEQSAPANADEPSFTSAEHVDWRNDFFASADRVKIDLFRRYGLIACAGDRHLAEFCPHSWYLKDPAQVRSWKFSLTPVSWRIENRAKLIKKAKAYRSGAEVMDAMPSGEEGLKIIKALAGLGNLTTNVNLPNAGQMPGITGGAVVETNALFQRDHIYPVITKGLPGDINALVMPHVSAAEGVVKAVFDRDMTAAFRVFSQDFSIQNLDLKDARSLFDDMASKTGVREAWA